MIRPRVRTVQLVAVGATLVVVVFGVGVAAPAKGQAPQNIIYDAGHNFDEATPALLTV